MKKNHKRIFAFAGAILISALVLSGCGGSKSDRAYSGGNSASLKESSATADYAPGYASDVEYYYDDVAYDTSYSQSNTTTGKENTDYLDNNDTNSSRKLIKRVSMSLETLEFDKSISMIEDYVREYHGYIENSSVHNNDYYTTYYNRSYNRSASYTIRIPNDLVDQFVSNAGNIGNITSNSTSTEDITLGYLDVESRAKALEIQQERLLALLEEASSVDEIISLEDRISQVTYELEARKSTLRNYDNLVSYSTVTITLNEVARITEPVPETVGERIASGFRETMYDITEGLKDFVVWFVVNLPYIIIFLIVVAIAITICCLIIKWFKKLTVKKYEKDKKKLQAKREAYEKQQAEKAAQQEKEETKK
ncbi:MAG: DUF4349 domain-containing protein [Lachnospiraceae bacterium]|nr:DUF4349 domain-containing protein [Lachnospiraceae bacterium]